MISIENWTLIEFFTYCAHHRHDIFVSEIVDGKQNRTALGDLSENAAYDFMIGLYERNEIPPIVDADFLTFMKVWEKDA